jgi:hypothetical protein
MTKIADLVSALDHVVEAERKLAECRRQASGDVDYFSFSFVQDLKEAETDLEQTLNAYIDQRLAQKLEQFKMPAGFELPARPVALAA